MRPGARCLITTRRQGASLILVLGMVALLMVLVLAVLDTGRGRLRQSRVVVDGLEADALAKLPTEIILTQLQQATSRSQTEEGEPLVWTSQPGMIRVFGTQVPSGQGQPSALAHYRLYSSGQMVSPTLNVIAESAGLDAWAEQPTGFTDLNEPRGSASGTSTVFPIADPGALDKVEGFALRRPAPGANTAHPLPLPAAWMYVLKDGRLVMPASTAGTQATFSAKAVTKANPIVGRIAFWTDDESCKLNLNTASEGAGWEAPAANTVVDRANATQAPAIGENYRLSAHPAFTSLSPVLQSFGGASGSNVQWPCPDPIDPLDQVGKLPWRRYLDCYQGLLPNGVETVAGSVPALIQRHDRHFATVDEFYFDPQRQRNGSGHDFMMHADDLRRSHFFLTPRSNAPEFNPFGGPKLSLWTLPSDTAQRSSTDRRMEAVTTINAEAEQAYAFAFQRLSNWGSVTSPGSSQSMTDDWSQVQRNRELYAWLQQMTARPMPGFGGRLVDKYGPGSRDQILTSMFDLLRWGSNASLPPSPGEGNPQGWGEKSAVPLTLDNNTRGYGRFPTITEVAVVFAFTDVDRTADGQPRDDNHDGICDRASKLRAFVVVNPFIAAAGPPAVSPAWTLRFRQLMHWSISTGIGLQLPGGNSFDRCFLSGSLPVQGEAAWGEHATAYAGFAAQFLQADGTPKMIGKREDPARDYPFISQNDIFLPANDGRPGSMLAFNGGRIRVDVMPPNAIPASPKPGDSIHSVEMDFPNSALPSEQIPLPVPSLRVADFMAGPRSLAARFQPVKDAQGWHLPLIQADDIVRSMVLNTNGPSHGDARLVAAKRELVFPEAADWFAPHPDYGTASTPANERKLQAHSLRDGVRSIQEPGPAVGSMLRQVNYTSHAAPAVPVGLNGALQTTAGNDPGGRAGDWENGPGLLPDGAFICRSTLEPGGAFTRGQGTPAETGNEDPLRQMGSAVQFGALPSGLLGGRVDAANDKIDPTGRAWQTLLFCPNPAGRTTAADAIGRYDETARDHFGFASPPDHLWLDFFWMPVTQPWAISHDFATEGKVNLNSQLMPFTWLRRDTALHGVLKGVRMTAIPSAAQTHVDDNAKGRGDGSALDLTFRYAVNADKTLAAAEQRFDAGEVFRSPSEICSVFLVPQRIAGHRYNGDDWTAPDPADLDAASMMDWWNGNAADSGDAFEATGDNLREAPYGQIYPRVCTQSNVYRVHYRVQVLRKSRSTKPEQWDEAVDQVVMERRGSDAIERRFNGSSAVLPDPATASAAPALATRAAFRVLSREPFTP